jgi:hypothetical protein
VDKVKNDDEKWAICVIFFMGEGKISWCDETMVVFYSFGLTFKGTLTKSYLSRKHGYAFHGREKYPCVDCDRTVVLQNIPFYSLWKFGKMVIFNPIEPLVLAFFALSIWIAQTTMNRHDLCQVRN